MRGQRGRPGVRRVEFERLNAFKGFDTNVETPSDLCESIADVRAG